MKTRVILIRHGQSSFNVEQKVQGHCDQSTLTKIGKDQALQVGSALTGIRFDAIYSSPLQRARQTAELIASVLKAAQPETPNPQFTDDLKEINLAEWEGMPFADVKANFPNGYALWRHRPHELSMSQTDEHGQTREFFPVVDLYEQARQFWRTLLASHGGETVLVVAHSAINRALIGTAIGLGPETLVKLGQANCAINVLNFTGLLGDPVQLESMNLTAHMGTPLPEMRSHHQGPRLLLVRHGETEWNRLSRFQGQIDVPLNDNGRAQGQRVADFLRSVVIHRAVTSPMLRPKETAEMILAHHPQVALEQVAALQEISHGLWEGKLESEIEVDYPGLLQQWKTQPETVQMPDGENLQQVWDRAVAAWRQIVAAASGHETPQTVMVVAHDAINKAILCHVVGLEPHDFWTFKQGNGAVSVIDYPNGVDSSPVLTASNMTSHLSDSILDQTAAGAL